MFDLKTNTRLGSRLKEMLEDTSSLGRSVEYDFTNPLFLSDENILDVHWYLFRKNTFLIKKPFRREKLHFWLWKVIPFSELSCPKCSSYFVEIFTPIPDFSGRMDTFILIRYKDEIFQAGDTWGAFTYKLTCPNCQTCTIEHARSISRRIKLGINFTDNSAIDILPHHPEWVKCPSCRINFKYTYEGSFKDGRHWSCGQKLNIIDEL